MIKLIKNELYKLGQEYRDLSTLAVGLAKKVPWLPDVFDGTSLQILKDTQELYRSYARLCDKIQHADCSPAMIPELAARATLVKNTIDAVMDAFSVNVEAERILFLKGLPPKKSK